MQPVLVIHGGAGAMSRAALSPEKEREFHEALQRILRAGHEVLANGGSALDAVTAAVVGLEDCSLFNAGHGAVFTSAGTHELDASIMDGSNLRTGAIANVHHIRNPVLAARKVMEESRHVFFVGEGAETFAQEHGIQMVERTYFSTPERHAQLLRVQKETPGVASLDDGQRLTTGSSAEALDPPNDPLDVDKKFGTVGAVALDAQGNLAAATSTGGITNKQVGRIGDAPIIGAGCYASNQTCAVSSTGTGEMYIRLVAAYDIAARMRYAGASLQEAAEAVMYQEIPSIGGKGGLIAVDAQGNIALPFNTEGMYRGYMRVGQEPVTDIYR
jgi:beta-aspartyl-peptidase (threonine type)